MSVKHFFLGSILQIFLLVVSCSAVYAQTDTSEVSDIETITAVFHNNHIIKDNSITYDYRTLLLQTFDEKSKLIREIYNNTNEPGIEKYKFYFYKDNKIARIETYNSDDKLIEKEERHYNDNGNLNKKIVAKSGGDHPVIEETYTLSGTGKPLKIIGRSDVGKKLYTTKYSYDAKDRLIQERWKSKIDFPGDKIKKYDAEIEEDENGKVKVLTADITYFSGDSETYIRKSEKEDGKTSWHLYYTPDNTLIKKERSIFDKDGELLRFTIYDDDGKVLKHVNYERKKKSIHLGNVYHYLD